MLIQIIIASALATAFGIGLNNYRQTRQSRRLEKLLIEGLQADKESPAFKRRLVSANQLEMEALLLNLRIASDALVTALAVEESLGAQVYASDGKDQSLFDRWTASRRADEQAHEAYNLAVQEYREFVHSLAPPLRAQAAERGYSAMAVASA